MELEPERLTSLLDNDSRLALGRFLYNPVYHLTQRGIHRPLCYASRVGCDPAEYEGEDPAQACLPCWLIYRRPDGAFANVEAFYDADSRRRRSEECDYGVHWHALGQRDRWRVSYVKTTGEIYATRHYTPLVLILGTVPADDEAGGLYYRTLEKLLDGWAEMCTEPGGLEWVGERLGLEVPHAAPGT